MIRVGFLITESRQLSSEEQAAWKWLASMKSLRAKQVRFDRLSSSTLEQFDVLWWHDDLSLRLPDECLAAEVQKALLGYIRKGGSLLCSLLAAQYVHALGLESTPPNVLRKDAWDQECWIENYPDIRGFGSNQGHPIFDGLAGAVFTWNPTKGVPFSGAFYADPVQPAEGKVVAVERQYIKLNEDWRMISEYEHGKGRVISIGSFFFFSFPHDRFRLHLEKFANNCFSYLADPKRSGSARTYWRFGPRTVTEVPHSSKPLMTGPQELGTDRSGLAMSREPDQVSDAFFDVGGRRILIMGKEQGGIEEVWCHPFRMLRSLRTGFQAGSGALRWLDQLKPRVTMRPESMTRVYSIGELRIEETVIGSVDRPGGIIHYHVDTNHPVQIVVSAGIDQRIMWPHSENATGSLRYSWDEQLQGFVVTNDLGNLVSVFGASRPADEHLAGQFDAVEWDGAGLKGHPTEVVQVGAGLRFAVGGKSATFSIVIAGSDGGEKEAIGTYRSLVTRPGAVLKHQAKYFRDLFRNSTMIESPDQQFNEGYQWALVGTDRFFVETPKLGTSLMAGFGTTERGWDGGQKISGRPGYAWYFGRDACWTAFAMLNYGSYDKVREVLRFLGTYQDLNGKILHEMTTSGHVHYDAADSTPLYCILMGRYVQASGDAAFAKAQFAHLKQAVDFCLSTDTDKDHLIENTNVGHGWVEGGKLFPVHTEFYLAACWSAALEGASIVARAAGKPTLAGQWKKEAERVRKQIRKDFWNEKTKFYNFGKFADGSYNQEKTALPAVATIFNCTDLSKIDACLDAWSGHTFSTDWGVRIIGSDNPMFNPEGYHYGSVWPLFTGWVALAEFVSGRPVQGFMHTLGTMFIDRHWAAGYVEEVLNGRVFKPSGVCSHQAWSESMVLQPLLEGMLGLWFDATQNQLVLRPWFPPGWDRAAVRNIRVGRINMSVEMTRQRGKVRYTLTSSARLKVRLEPLLPLGTRINEIASGRDRQIKNMTVLEYAGVSAVQFSLKGKKTVEFLRSGGIGVIPPSPLLEEGIPSQRLRIVKDFLAKDAYVIEVEGPRGSTQDLQLYDPARAAVGASGAELVQGPEGSSIRISFEPEGKASYQRKSVTITLRAS